MTDFKTMWTGKDKKLSSEIRKQLSPKKKLRDKIQQATHSLELQNRKLDVALRTLREKDKYYYTKVLEALRTHDRSRAILYANELAELRKALKSISAARLALEQITLRLNTVKDIGDIMVAISPAMSVVKGVRENIMHVLPQAEDELYGIQEMLTHILVDAEQTAGINIDFTAANDEAERILREAEAHVEREMKEKLPGIPAVGEEEKHSEFMY